ncbi:MAG: hypothetical protein PVF45_12940, partial [Anaerolineae bacterium]
MLDKIQQDVRRAILDSAACAGRPAPQAPGEWLAWILAEMDLQVDALAGAGDLSEISRRLAFVGSLADAAATLVNAGVGPAGQHDVAPPVAQVDRATLLAMMTSPKPICPQCESGEVSFHGDQFVTVTEGWTGGEAYAGEEAPPQGEWVGPVQGECAECDHQWTVLPSRPMHLSEQAYLVVYLDAGVVTDHEIVAGVERARRKCLAHVGEADLCTHLDGTLRVTDDRDLDAWAFPVPATVTVTVDEKRPANEDQIQLYCKFSTPGMGLCGWTGLASEAGWNSHYEEWICPDCGATDG